MKAEAATGCIAAADMTLEGDLASEWFVMHLSAEATK
jgi:hypothetical protein